MYFLIVLQNALKISENSQKAVHKCSIKNNSKNFFFKIYRKTPVLESLFKKRPPAQFFSCEFCKIFQNCFFVEHVQMTVPKFTRINS